MVGGGQLRVEAEEIAAGAWVEGAGVWMEVAGVWMEGDGV